MNVVTQFELQVRRDPSAPALAWDGGALRYGELDDLARRMAALLAERGIAPGERIALLLPNVPAFPVVLLGALRHGAVAVILSPAWAPIDATRALALADARLLVTTATQRSALGTLSTETLLVDDTPEMGSLGRALAAQCVPTSTEPHACDEGTVATILFSSGTTGDPKRVMLTHGNLLFNARSKIRYCGITAADRLAMVVPIAHCFGQNVVLLGALLAGASVRLFTRFDAGPVRDAIGRGEVSMLLAAPAAFERLLALGDPAPLRRLRYALTAAAPPRATLASRWHAAAGQRLAQGYGMTECSPFATYQPDAGHSSAVGTPIGDVDVRIALPDGRLAAADEEGEIVIRGPNVMAGYWRRPEDSARALRDGWLHTGDVGHLDARGVLHLTGRLDDVINVAGFKTWPADVERVLDEHPAVLESAVCGVADDVRGMVVAAAVVVRPGETTTVDALMQFASARLAGFQRPAHLRIVGSLPRSASGKVLRRELAAQFQRASHESPAYTERPATGLPAPSR